MHGQQTVKKCSYIVILFSRRSLYTGVCVHVLRLIEILAGHVQLEHHING